MNLKLVAVGLTLTASSLAAQSDSIPKTLLTRRDAMVGATAAVTAVAMSKFDPRIARFFADTSNAHVRTGQRLGDVFTHINETTLTIAGIAAYGAGRLTRSDGLTDVAFHTTEAVVAASLASQIIRGPLGRSRPRVVGDSNQYDFHWFKGFRTIDYRAFPSIHASSAFAAATALVQETRLRRPGAVKVVAPLLYGVALTPALARMYLRQHWASDIFAGAVVGTVAGLKAVNYSHTHPGNRFQDFFVPRNGLSVAPAPGGIGFSWGRTF